MPLVLRYISTLQPSATARAWHTAAHPYLPIVATSSADKAVRIYSLTSFTLLTTIAGGHKRSIRSSAWKPGIRGDHESVLATGSFDATAGIWKSLNSRIASIDRDENGNIDDDSDSNDEFRFAVILEGHDSEVKSVAWSCHGSYLATSSRDKSVWIWEALDSSNIHRPNILRSNDVMDLEYDDDEENFETVAVLQEHEGDVKCVAWHPSDEKSLASGSYDENVRIWREDVDTEWSCVGLCEGHEGTVWCIDWEPHVGVRPLGLADGDGPVSDLSSDFSEAVSGPRLVSCSDDLAIKIWKRQPKEPPLKENTENRLPSIIRNNNEEEEWFEETTLPPCHERPIYAVSWSVHSRRIVSCGGDGRIVVYAEQPSDDHMLQNEEPLGLHEGRGITLDQSKPARSMWKIVAEIESAHGVFEVNHVCWARRADSAKYPGDEEIIISTGDDGEVKVWSLREG